MSLPYFPLYPSDFEAKTSHLTLEEDGAYNRLLRLSWMTPGCSLPDDPAWIARRMRVDAATFERVVSPLIDEFFTRSKGRLVNRKLVEIFNKSNEKHSRRVEAGKLGGRPAKVAQTKEKMQSNARAMPKQPEPEPEPEPEEVREERGKPLSRPSEDFEACLSHFNTTADRVGWPKVQRLTPPRMAALSQRISDIGGEDAWREAIDRAAQSPLLTGQTGRGWRADFDWLCEAANFTKLMEGNYDPQRSSNSGTSRGSGMVDAFAAVAAARSGRA